LTTRLRLSGHADGSVQPLDGDGDFNG
jgi:hypothetical protein